MKHLILLLLLPAMLHAQPQLTHRAPVDDYADLFTPAQEQQLAAHILAFFDTVQIAIVTTPTLSGQDIAAYGTTLYNQWGIGLAGKNNGMLILIAPTEHRAYIATGRGIQGTITDAVAARLQRTHLIPAFRQGQWYTGTSQMLLAAIATLRTDNTLSPIHLTPPHNKNIASWLLICFATFIIILCVPIISIIYTTRKRRTPTQLPNFQHTPPPPVNDYPRMQSRIPTSSSSALPLFQSTPILASNPKPDLAKYLENDVLPSHTPPTTSSYTPSSSPDYSTTSFSSPSPDTSSFTDFGGGSTDGGGASASW